MSKLRTDRVGSESKQGVLGDRALGTVVPAVVGGVAYATYSWPTACSNNAPARHWFTRVALFLEKTIAWLGLPAIFRAPLAPCERTAFIYAGPTTGHPSPGAGFMVWRLQAVDLGFLIYAC